MTRRWHNLLDSFAYLSEQDIRWLEKSRVTVDIAEFPRSCGRMILATIGIALLIPIGFALVGGEIWSSVYIATHMTTPILGVPMGIAIGMLAFATFRLFIQTLKAIIRLQKCYLFLLYDSCPTSKRVAR